MSNEEKYKLVIYITNLTQQEFESWVNTASDEEIDVALEHYEHLNEYRSDSDLPKYESQAREVIKKAMRP